MTRCDINICEQRLSRKYNYEWSIKCSEIPKLPTYITFKTNYETENYVKCCLSKQERSFKGTVEMWRSAIDGRNWSL